MKKMKTMTSDEWITSTFLTAPVIPDNAITVEMVIDKTGLSRSQSIGRLNIAVKKGELHKGKFLKDGKVFNYYVPIQKK